MKKSYSCLQTIQFERYCNTLNHRCPHLGNTRLSSLYPHQVNLIDSLLIDKNVIVKSARQIGISTILTSFTHWYTNVYKDKFCVFVSPNGNGRDSHERMFCDLNSSIYSINSASNHSYDSGRIKFVTPVVGIKLPPVVDLLIMNDMAFTNPDPFYHDICKKLHKDSLVIINSNPYVKGDNWFYNFYKENNNFKKISLDCSVIPSRRSKSYLDSLKSRIGNDNFQREALAKFCD